MQQSYARQSGLAAGANSAVSSVANATQRGNARVKFGQEVNDDDFQVRVKCCCFSSVKFN